MLRVQTVLYPHQYSANPSAAVEVACALARDYKAALVLVHAVEPALVSTDNGLPHPYPSGLADGASDRLRTVRIDAPPPAVVRHRVAVGVPAEEILRVAAAEAADPIVTGTHGRTGLSRLATGSVAEGGQRRFTAAGPRPLTPADYRADGRAKVVAIPQADRVTAPAVFVPLVEPSRQAALVAELDRRGAASGG